MDIKSKLLEARLWAEMYAINNPRRVVMLLVASLLANLILAIA